MSHRSKKLKVVIIIVLFLFLVFMALSALMYFVQPNTTGEETLTETGTTVETVVETGTNELYDSTGLVITGFEA